LRRGRAGVALIAGVTLAAGAVALLRAADVPARAAGEITQLKDAPGRDVTEGRCIICHSLEYIPSNAPAMNRAGWQKSIQKMRERFGAPVTDEQAQRILDYLDANYSGKS
jgi:sulfite dehydrogenase (cytochrome) subunit B